MKCEDAERLIYLDAELSAREKQALEEHLSTCTACTSLANSFSAVQAGIQDLSKESPVPFDSARLTQKVMERVNPTELAQNTPRILKGFFLRLGLTGLSLFLIISFFAEFNRSRYMIPESTGETLVVHTGGSKTLQDRNTKQASMMSIIQNRKEIETNEDQ